MIGVDYFFRFFCRFLGHYDQGYDVTITNNHYPMEVSQDTVQVVDGVFEHTLLVHSSSEKVHLYESLVVLVHS